MRESKHNSTAIVLLIAYVVVFAVLAIHPYQRDVWFTENMTILPIALILTAMYCFGYRFSTLAYVLMAFLIFLHTVGGHYTFERVPFGAVTRFFGWERNNYDRFAHTTVGFYAFAIAEFVTAKRYVTNRWAAALFGLFAVMALAAVYEIFEWRYAVMSDPKAGIAVLGSQGDVWDAQEDMLCDTVGGILASILFLAIQRPSAAQAGQTDL